MPRWAIHPIPVMLLLTIFTGPGVAGENPVVMMISPGQIDDAGPVISSVQNHLREIHVELRLSNQDFPSVGLPEQLAIAAEQARQHDAIAVLWVDLALAEQFFLYLSGHDSNRVLVRQLGGMTGEGLAETVALIVRTTVEEMLSGGRIGMESTPTVPKTNEARGDRDEGTSPVASLPQPRQLFSLETAYVYTAVSDKIPSEQGFNLGMELSPWRNLWVRLSYTILQPIVANGDLSDLRVARHPLGLGLGLDILLNRISVAPELGLVMDVATLENFNLAPGMTATEDRVDVGFAASIAFRVSLFITKNVLLFARVAAWVPFVHKNYVVEGFSSRESLHQPFHVQPVVMVGISTHLP